MGRELHSCALGSATSLDAKFCWACVQFLFGNVDKRKLTFKYRRAHSHASGNSIATNLETRLKHFSMSIDLAYNITHTIFLVLIILSDFM